MFFNTVLTPTNLLDESRAAESADGLGEPPGSLSLSADEFPSPARRRVTVHRDRSLRGDDGGDHWHDHCCQCDGQSLSDSHCAASATIAWGPGQPPGREG